MNRKVESFKQTVFLPQQYSVKSYNKCSRCCLSALTHAHNRIALVYCPADNTMFMFKVGPEIRCSGVSSRYCCCGNHAAASKTI